MPRFFHTLILLPLLLLVPSISMMAQWSGSVSGKGGWNFKEGNEENGSVKIKYTGQKFYIGGDMYSGHTFQPSTQTTEIYDMKQSDGYYKAEEKKMSPRNFNIGGGIDFGYIFNPENILEASVSYLHNNKSDHPVLNSFRLGGDVPETLSGTQMDSSLRVNNSINDRIAYTHRFKDRSDASLKIILSNVMSFNNERDRRIAEGDIYSKRKNYATYSSLNDFDTRLYISYDDVFEFEKSRLKMTSGMDFITKQNLDGYFAETYVGGHWRDSTEYKQSYFYESFTVEPYANLTYTIGKFDLFLYERVQWYLNALTDKLDRKSPGGLEPLFKKENWQNLLSTGVTYRINQMHKLTLGYSRSIIRPDYKKLCTTLMIGGSEGEYIRGNPDLKPEIMDKFNFRYTYSKGIFITTLDLNFRNKTNTAEKVIDMEYIKDVRDPVVNTLYTWINNKRQESYGARLDFKMNGQDVKAEIWSGLNYDIYGNNKEFNKEDFNYELGTSVDVFLSETSRLTSSLVYISEKESAFNMKGEDVLANLRFTKTVTKGLDIFVELNDLVDKAITEDTGNEEMNYLKTSITIPMHRRVLLGLNYYF